MLMREYETVILVDTDGGTDALDKALGRMREALGSTSGREVKLEDWGRRKIAYKLRNRARAHYLMMTYLGSNETVAELERLMGITEPVIKWQTKKLADRIDAASYDFEEARRHTSGLAIKSHLEGTTLGAPEPEPVEAAAEAAETSDTNPTAEEGAAA